MKNYTIESVAGDLEKIKVQFNGAELRESAKKSSEELACSMYVVLSGMQQAIFENALRTAERLLKEANRLNRGKSALEYAAENLPDEDYQYRTCPYPKIYEDLYAAAQAYEEFLEASGDNEDLLKSHELVAEGDGSYSIKVLQAK
jgi:hypothetical protein